MEHLHTFRASEKIVDFCFSPLNNKIIYALERTGTVYVWDLGRRGNSKRFADEGCVGARNISLSSNGQFIACG